MVRCMHIIGLGPSVLVIMHCRMKSTVNHKRVRFMKPAGFMSQLPSLGLAKFYTLIDQIFSLSSQDWYGCLAGSKAKDAIL